MTGQPRKKTIPALIPYALETRCLQEVIYRFNVFLPNRFCRASAFAMVGANALSAWKQRRMPLLYRGHSTGGLFVNPVVDPPAHPSVRELVARKG